MRTTMGFKTLKIRVEMCDVAVEAQVEYCTWVVNARPKRAETHEVGRFWTKLKDKANSKTRYYEEKQ